MELTYLEPADSPGKISASSDVTEVEFTALEPDVRVVWRIDSQPTTRPTPAR